VSPFNGGIFIRESSPRSDGTLTDTAATGTGVMICVPIRCYSGDVITNITFVSGVATSATPTHCFFALYDDLITAPVLLAQTADQGNAAWATNTALTLALTAPVTIARAGIYWATCMVAGTPPSLYGNDFKNAVMTGAIITGQRKLSVTSGSSLTATAPGTIVSAGTAVSTRPYCCLT
jgi:hypothetical protein